MDIIGAIKGIALAVGNFFGWKQAREVNLPAQQKRDEVQQARKEKDDQQQAIDDFMHGRRPKP